MGVRLRKHLLSFPAVAVFLLRFSSLVSALLHFLHPDCVQCKLGLFPEHWWWFESSGGKPHVFNLMPLVKSLRFFLFCYVFCRAVVHKAMHDNNMAGRKTWETKTCLKRPHYKPRCAGNREGEGEGRGERLLSILILSQEQVHPPPPSSRVTDPRLCDWLTALEMWAVLGVPSPLLLGHLLSHFFLFISWFY